MKNRLRKALIITLLAITATLGGSTASWAHVDIDSTFPADGSVQPTAPKSSTITFLGLVDPATVTETMRKADGTKLADPVRTTPESPTSQVSFSLPSLSDGTYVIDYREASSDGHVVEGELSFSVGAAPATPITVKKGPNYTAGRTFEAFARNLFDLGAIVVAGAVFWLLILFPTKRKPTKKEVKEGITPTPNPLEIERDFNTIQSYKEKLQGILKFGFFFITFGLTARIAALIAQGLPGLNLTGKFNLITSRPVLTIFLGIVFAMIAIKILGREIISTLKLKTVITLGVAVLYTVALVSHAADQPLKYFDAALWASHVGLISLWIGPILIYALLKTVWRGIFVQSEIQEGLKQFAPLAIFAVIFSVVTGLSQAWVYAGGAIPKGEYLYLILGKITFLSAAVILGGYHNRKIARGKDISWKSYTWELLFFVIIIILGAILATTSPLSA